MDMDCYRHTSERLCCCSSLVEHVIGNDGVGSSILLSSTIFFNKLVDFLILLENLVSAQCPQKPWWVYYGGQKGDDAGY